VLYERLAERTSLGPGHAVFEVGPGPGVATGRLLAMGADPLVAVEPDARLAAYLKEAFPSPAFSVIEAPFEAADLGTERFDLGAAATSFHWVRQREGLAKVFAALKPGGWWAAWWTIFGVEDGPDAFQDATRHLFEKTPRAPGYGRKNGFSFAADREDRFADLTQAGFTDLAVDAWPWAVCLDSAQIVALYASFSPIKALPVDWREALLNELAQIVDQQFGGQVERRISTVLYTARRP
jgi:hypothetical protein